MLHPLIKLISEWKNISNYKNRKIIDNNAVYNTVEYVINTPTILKNKSIIFVTDTHFRGSNFPYSDLADSINIMSPDWIIFGGDIVHYMSYVNDAVVFLSKLNAKKSKLAVLGNWETQKLQWKQDNFWEKTYNKSGFELLTNSIKEFTELSFAGIVPHTKSNPIPYEEFKNSFRPELDQLLKINRLKNKFTCLLSHSPVTFIQNFSTESISPDLVLCGHTHGGQIRIPTFGALVTSSIYWKLFEYGHYYSRKQKTDIIISNGIGCTGPKFRCFCKPEIVKISFK